jgi:hypothetical protein
MQMGIDAPAITSIRESTAERKLTHITDEAVVRADLALPARKGEDSPIRNPLSQPVRVGIYQGATGNMDEGWTRYVFDTFNVPFSTIRDNDVRQGGLNSKFDVVLLPSTRRPELDSGAAGRTEQTDGAEAGITNLKNFVTAGGTIVCFDNSCNMLISQFQLPLKNTLQGVRSSEFYCPGSILAIDLEGKEPMAAKLPSTMLAYFTNSSAYSTTDSSVKVIARYAKESLLRSGWLLGEDKLRSQIALAEVPVGKGRVVVFGFRPQHRGQSWGTLSLIWNALSTSVKGS